MTIKFFPDMFKLDGKTIVVTGAGLIGSELIKGLSEAGAKVIISEINEQKGIKLERVCKKENLDVIYKNLDITNEKSIDEFIRECLENFGKIDGWVNTAYPRTEDWGKKEQLLNYSSWKKNIEMHLGGYCLTSMKAAEAMKERGFGSIINFSSIYGVSAPDFSIYEGTNMTTPIPYVVIKGGINMLTKYLASYYGKYNIRINTITLGGVFNNQPESFRSKYVKKTCLGRMALPKDIVGAVIYLQSDAASYITGHNLVIDGGFTIK
ncbi:MAG: oxidoreductase [Promethearchaeota archaeon]